MTAKQQPGTYAPDGSMYVTLTNGSNSLDPAAGPQVAGSAILGKVGVDQTTPGTTNGVVVNPAVTPWAYAAPNGADGGGAAVQIAAAAGVGLRNYCSSIQIYATTGGSEIGIKDGATVIWRTSIPTGATRDIVFGTPLRGTANTALSVQVFNGGTAVYYSAQGFVAA